MLQVLSEEWQWQKREQMYDQKNDNISLNLYRGNDVSLYAITYSGSLFLE
jgi:hypothetical protein